MQETCKLKSETEEKFNLLNDKKIGLNYLEFFFRKYVIMIIKQAEKINLTTASTNIKKETNTIRQTELENNISSCDLKRDESFNYNSYI